ncbi:MAG: dienelactone hydrolase [Burkholderiales bacterium]
MRALHFAAGALLGLLGAAAQAATGLAELAGLAGDGPVTVFYASSDAAQPVKRGPFELNVAWQGAPVRGNGRLVVVSHGSGGSPWVHADLAQALVAAGFVVALPEHAGDNYKDTSGIGPASWRKRPAEVTRAIDAIGKDARFAPLLKLDRVGVYGMSAGGHTALTLAGGRWAPAQVARHCEAHIRADFPACVGLSTRLTGGWSDSFKIWTSLAIIGQRFSDASWVSYSDPRVRAVVAAVPYAADFDMASFAAPPVPLGLVSAAQDKWLAPRFHSEAVLAACKPCERVADLANGGHGALLSPFPPKLSEAAAELLNDPPGFDRKLLPEVDRKIADFFRRHL